MLESQQVNQ